MQLEEPPGRCPRALLRSARPWRGPVIERPCSHLVLAVSDEESIAGKIEGLGIKQREFRQLTDTLVVRGYITREVDPANGSVTLALTERGRAASEATTAGVNFVDQELERRLTEAEMAGLRRGLAVLGEIKQSLAGPVLRRGLPQ